MTRSIVQKKISSSFFWSLLDSPFFVLWQFPCWAPSLLAGVVSPCPRSLRSLTSRQLQLVHNHICSKPIFTKFNRLSILVANSHNLILLSICSIFQPMEQALPSLSDGWHACFRRCQLALDLTARGTGFTHPPLHSPGDCNVVGVFVSLFVSSLLLSWKNFSCVFATFHLVLADRRATARTTTFVEPCSIQTKKKQSWWETVRLAQSNFIPSHQINVKTLKKFVLVFMSVL